MGKDSTRFLRITVTRLQSNHWICSQKPFLVQMFWYEKWRGFPLGRIDERRGELCLAKAAFINESMKEGFNQHISSLYLMKDFYVLYWIEGIYHGKGKHSCYQFESTVSYVGNFSINEKICTRHERISKNKKIIMITHARWITITICHIFVSVW